MGQAAASVAALQQAWPANELCRCNGILLAKTKLVNEVGLMFTKCLPKLEMFVELATFRFLRQPLAKKNWLMCGKRELVLVN